MPRQRTVTEAQVINAAFEVVRRQGFTSLTARSLAQQLGVSTMPIYSIFRSMERLVALLRARTLDLLTGYQAHSYTPDPYLNLALGYVKFAREEPQLFRFYFVDAPRALSAEAQEKMRLAVWQKLGFTTPPEGPLSHLPPSAQEAISLRSWIFTHGLAVMLSSGVLEDRTDAELQRLLEEAGGAFFLWASRADPN